MAQKNALNFNHQIAIFGNTDLKIKSLDISCLGQDQIFSIILQ